MYRLGVRRAIVLLLHMNLIFEGDVELKNKLVNHQDVLVTDLQRISSLLTVRVYMSPEICLHLIGILVDSFFFFYQMSTSESIEKFELESKEIL